MFNLQLHQNNWVKCFRRCIKSRYKYLTGESSFLMTLDWICFQILHSFIINSHLWSFLRLTFLSNKACHIQCQNNPNRLQLAAGTKWSLYEKSIHLLARYSFLFPQIYLFNKNKTKQKKAITFELTNKESEVQNQHLYPEFENKRVSTVLNSRI